MKNYRNNKQDLVEGLNVKDMVLDVIQVGLDSGAIVISGGLGGDTIVDTLFASSEAAEILKFVKDIWSEMKIIGAILKDIETFDLTQGLEKFYTLIQNSVHVAVKTGLVGQDVIKFLEEVKKEVDQLINEIVRAISKWVGALIPDDFGLGGPTFEATVTTAIKNATQKPYELVGKGIHALPQFAQDLLLDTDALTSFLQDCVKQLIDYVEKISDKIMNPDPDKSGLVDMFIANTKLQGEMLVSPLTGLANVISTSRGGEEMFDTIGQDMLDNLEALPSWHPTRKILAKSLPPVENFLEEIEQQYCDEAAETLSFLMKVLLGCLGVLQIAMDPELLKKLSELEQNQLIDFGFENIELTPEDLAMEVATKGSIHKWNLKQLLG